MLPVLAMLAGCVSETNTPELEKEESTSKEFAPAKGNTPAAEEVHTQDVYMQNPRGSNGRPNP